MNGFSGLLKTGGIGRLTRALSLCAVVTVPQLGLLPASENSSARAPADSLTAQLVAREKEALDAIRHRDWTAYAATMAPNYQEVGLEGYHTRDQALAAIEQMRLTGYLITNAHTVLVAPGVAVITFRGTLIGTFAGKQMQTAPFAYHDVWVRDGPVWQMVFSEETTIPATR
jgi:hypothetical protein